MRTSRTPRKFLSGKLVLDILKGAKTYRNPRCVYWREYHFAEKRRSGKPRFGFWKLIYDKHLPTNCEAARQESRSAHCSGHLTFERLHLILPMERERAST